MCKQHSSHPKLTINVSLHWLHLGDNITAEVLQGPVIGTKLSLGLFPTWSFTFIQLLLSFSYLQFDYKLVHLTITDIYLENAMAPHSSTLAWKIPWMEEPGRLQSMRSLRVGHDWATSLSLFTFMHWSRKWQPTPVFLPGESQGRGSLVGCHLWGRTESDTTEAT